MKIYAPIDLLSVTTAVNVTGTLAAGCLYRPSALDALSSLPYASGVVTCDGSTSNPYFLGFSDTSAHKLIGRVDHTSSTGTTYNIDVADAEAYPYILFEMYVRKVTSDGDATTTLTINSDVGSNYLLSGFGESGTLGYLQGLSGSLALASVNVSTSSSFSNTGYTRGYANLKSGSMRSIHTENSTSTGTTLGYSSSYVRWTNTADVVTQVNIVIPDNVNGFFKLYQQIG